MFVRLHALQGASSKDYQKEDQAANTLTGSENGSHHSKYEKMAARHR
jgi:hypothetical protein